MSALVVSRPSRSSAAVVSILLRVLGAAMLGATAGIHAYLWHNGYRSIPTIGDLFLLDVIAASVLTLLVLGVPHRLAHVVGGAGALLELGTVAGLLVATKVSLFGFVESTRATLYWQAVVTELVGTVILAVFTVVAYRRARRGPATSWW